MRKALILFLVSVQLLAAGQTNIGSFQVRSSRGTQAPSSIFEVNATTKGAIAAPKMSQTQRDAIASPTAGLQVFNTNTNKLNVYTGVGWSELGVGDGTSTPRNSLLNGAFNIWQRGTSTTVANGATAYQADRWYAKNSLGTNGVITYSRVTGSASGSLFGASLEITTAPTAAQANGTELYQTLENRDSILFYNQSASFSVQVKALGNVNQVGVQFFYKTTEAKVDTAIGSEQTATVNTSTSSPITISGQALGTSQTTAGVIGVRIRITGVSTGNMYDLGNGFIAERAMMNAGATVGAFTPAGSDHGDELGMCQRYYEKSYSIGSPPGTSTYDGLVIGFFPSNPIPSGQMALFTRFKVGKRTTPTVQGYSLAGTQNRLSSYNSAADLAADSGVAAVSGTQAMTWSNASGGTVGITPADGIGAHFTADAEI